MPFIFFQNVVIFLNRLLFLQIFYLRVLGGIFFFNVKDHPEFVEFFLDLRNLTIIPMNHSVHLSHFHNFHCAYFFGSLFFIYDLVLVGSIFFI